MDSKNGNNSLSVYPRTHGEQANPDNRRSGFTGLSPYSRGTVIKIIAHKHYDRFIPVLTGNSVDICHSVLKCAVYPRTHGEQFQKTVAPRGKVGLSPYSRGTEPLEPVTAQRWRFIPVLTGNRAREKSPVSVPPVYPRTHGEQALIWATPVFPCWFIPVLTGNR